MSRSWLHLILPLTPLKKCGVAPSMSSVDVWLLFSGQELATQSTAAPYTACCAGTVSFHVSSHDHSLFTVNFRQRARALSVALSMIRAWFPCAKADFIDAAQASRCTVVQDVIAS